MSAPHQALSASPLNPSNGTTNPNNGTEFEHTDRPSGKYWVACEQAPEGVAYCHIYRNGLLITQGRGRDNRAAWLEARRNLRAARPWHGPRCGVLTAVNGIWRDLG